MIIRGTTPTHTFTLPFEVDSVKELKITYSQIGKIVATKYRKDATIQGHTVTVRLSQRDTLAFASTGDVLIQLRVVTGDGTALASNIMKVSVDRCLDSEVLE